LSVQSVYKISNLCDHNPPKLQTDRQTDRQTDGHQAISIPRYAHSASRGKNVPECASCSLVIMLCADSLVISMSRGHAYLLILLSITCLLCMVAFLTPPYSFGITLQKRPLKNFNNLLTLDFVPRGLSRFTDCDNLFVGTPLDQYNMSSIYWSLYHKFQAAMPKRLHIEGHSGKYLYRKQAKVLHYLAARPSIRHICETGFNMGHSSFNFLTSNPKVIIHSFDIGRHDYTRVMARFMTQQFPGRFFIHLGDSRVTVPQFVQANPAFRCDLIFVDGGHTYTIATADLENFASICNRSNLNNTIIFDNYPSFATWARGLGPAWENLIRRHPITEIMRCMFSTCKYCHGYVIGTMRSNNSAAGH